MVVVGYLGGKRKVLPVWSQLEKPAKVCLGMRSAES